MPMNFSISFIVALVVGRAFAMGLTAVGSPPSELG